MDRDDPWQTAPWAHLLYSKGQPAVNPLRSVNIDLMHSHILPMIDVVQALFTFLHLTINKRRR